MSNPRKRPGWKTFFMDIAIAYASRSTCVSRQIGAIAVKDNHQIAAGYNGSPAGMPHCTDVGCMRKGIPSGEKLDRCMAVHAEENVIAMAAKFGITLDGADLYCTTKPCFICMKHIINAGIKTVYYINDYPSDLVDLNLTKQSRITFHCLDYLYEKEEKDGNTQSSEDG